MNRDEDYIVEHADTFDWDDFECSMNIYSEQFREDFKHEIKYMFHKDEKGDLHREDGPATIHLGKESWYLGGEELCSTTAQILKDAIKENFTSQEEKEDWYLQNIHRQKYREELNPLIKNFSKSFFMKALERKVVDVSDLFTWAAEKGEDKLVKTLADIMGPDYPCIGGLTAFMCASSAGNMETSKLLLELGANINAEDDNGRNSYMFCEFFHKEKMMEFIKNHKDYIKPEVELKLVVAKS